MQTKSANSMLVHNYRAVLKKCFWANIADRQTLLKSLGSLVSKSAIAGLIVAGMTGFAGNIEVNSQTGSVSISPCIQNITQIEESEFTSLIEENDLSATMSEDQFCEDYNGETYQGKIYVADKSGFLHGLVNVWNPAFTTSGGVNTLRLSAADTPGDVKIQYATFKMSGLIVEADGWKIVNAGSRPDTVLGDNTGINRFTINGNFSYAVGTFSIVGQHEWSVAANKTFTLDNTSTINGSINITGGGTVDFTGVATVNTGNTITVGSNITLKTTNATAIDFAQGSTLKLNNNSIVDKVNLSNATLDLTSVTLSDAVAFQMTNYTLGEGTIISLGDLSAGTYKIFADNSNGWDKLAIANFLINGQIVGARSLVLNTDGSIVFNTSGVIYDLVWTGGNGTWTNTTDTWDDTTTGVIENIFFADIDSVSFTSDATIDLQLDVTPKKLSVTAGNVVLGTTTVNKITGTSAIEVIGGSLTLNMANDYTGGTTITGGTLIMGHASALGSGPVSFNGGTIGVSETMDLSGLTMSATTGNQITFDVAADKILTVASSALADVVKTGAGTLAATGCSGNFSINVQAGTVDMTLTGTTTFTKIAGAGKIQTSGNTHLNIGGDNTGFTGNIYTESTSINITDKNALGTGTLWLNMGEGAAGKNLWMSFSGAGKDNELQGNIGVEAGKYGYLGGTDNMYFAGKLLGGGTLSMRSNGNKPDKTLYLVGDMREFTGVIATSINGQTWNLGAGGEAAIVDGKLFGDGAKLQGGGTFVINYSNDIILNAEILDTAKVIKNGAGTMTVNTANSKYTGEITISEGKVVLTGAGALGAGNIVNNAVLEINKAENSTISNIISGSGSLTNLGAGALTLSGENIYTGSTTISGGKVVLAENGTLGVGNIANNAALEINKTGNTTISGIISGTGSLTNLGAGILTLSGVNTYTGGTTISGGIVAAGNAKAFGEGAVNLASGTLDLSAIANSTTTALITNNITLTAESTLKLGAITADGTYKIFGGEVTNWGLLDLTKILIEDITTGGRITLTSAKAGEITIAGISKADLVWNNGDGTWSTNLVDKNWDHDSNPATANVEFLNGDSVTFNNATVDTTNTITIAGNVAPSTISVTGVGNITFDGTGSIVDNGGTATTLTKDGTGTLTINTANAYTGGTTITAGTLVMGHADAFGTTGNITFNGGTLKYGASINTDISSRISVADAGSVNVDVGSNSVTWATGTWGTENNTLVVNGETEGVLTLGWAGTANVGPANLTIQSGTVKLTQANSLRNSGNNITTNIKMSGGTLDINGQGTNSGSYATACSRFTYWFGKTIKFEDVAATGAEIKNSQTATGAQHKGIGFGTIEYVGGGATGMGIISVDITAWGTQGASNRTFNIGKSTLEGLVAEFKVTGNIGESTSAKDGQSITLVKNGEGTLWITGTNYTPALNIQEGTVIADSTQAFGNRRNIAGSLTVGATGTLDLWQSNSADTLTGDAGATITNTSENVATLTIGKAANGTSYVTTSSFAGTINGNVALLFHSTGAGTLTLSGVNTYTGGTTISGGKVILTENGTLGSGNIVNNAVLEINKAEDSTISTIISGAGSLTNSGAGILTLSGENTYEGGTMITTGTVVAGNARALGAGAVTLNGGTLDLGDFAVANNITYTGGIISKVANYTGTLTVESDLTLDGGISDTGKVVINAEKAFTSNTIIKNVTGDATTAYNYTGASVNVALETDLIGFEGALNNTGSGSEDVLTLQVEGNKTFNVGSGWETVNKTGTGVLTLGGNLSVVVIDIKEGVLALDSTAQIIAANMKSSAEATLELVDGITIDGEVLSQINGEKLIESIKSQNGFLGNILFALNEWSLDGRNEVDIAGMVLGSTGAATVITSSKDIVIANAMGLGTKTFAKLDITGGAVTVANTVDLTTSEIAIAAGATFVQTATGQLTNGATTNTTISGAGTFQIGHRDAEFVLKYFTGTLSTTVDYDFSGKAITGAKNVNVGDSTTATLSEAQFESSDLTSITGANVDVVVNGDNAGVAADLTKVKITGTLNATTEGQTLLITGAGLVDFTIGGNFSIVNLDGSGEGQTLDMTKTSAATYNVTGGIVTLTGEIGTGKTVNVQAGVTTINDNIAGTVAITAGAAINHGNAVTGTITGEGAFNYTGTTDFTANIETAGNFSGFAGTLNNESGNEIGLILNNSTAGVSGFDYGNNWSSVTKTGAGELSVDVLHNVFNINEGTVKLAVGTDITYAGTITIKEGASFNVASGLTLSGKITGAGNLSVTGGKILSLTENSAIVDETIIWANTDSGIINLFDGAQVGGFTVGADTQDKILQWIEEMAGKGYEVNYAVGQFSGNLDVACVNGVWNKAKIELYLAATDILDNTVSIGTTGNMPPLIIDDYTSFAKNTEIQTLVIGAGADVTLNDNKNLISTTITMAGGKFTVGSSDLGDKTVSGTGSIITTSDFIVGSNFNDFTGVISTERSQTTLTINNAKTEFRVEGFLRVIVDEISSMNNVVNTRYLEVVDGANLTAGKNFVFAGRLEGGTNASITADGAIFKGNANYDANYKDSYKGKLTGAATLVSSTAFKDATVKGANLTIQGSGNELGTVSDTTLTLNLGAGGVVNAPILSIAKDNQITSYRTLELTTDKVINGRISLLASEYAESYKIKINGREISVGGKDDIGGDHSIEKYVLEVIDGVLTLSVFNYVEEGNKEQVIAAYDPSAAQASATVAVVNTAQSLNNILSSHLTGVTATGSMPNNNMDFSVRNLTSQDRLMASTSSGVLLLQEDDTLEQFSVWGQAVYSRAEHDGVNNISDSTENSFGGLIGFEKGTQHYRHGLFASGISSDVKGDNGSKTESESAYLGYYAGFTLSNNYFVNVGIMAGYTQVDTERRGGYIGDKITGDYNSYMANIYGETGRMFNLTDNVYARVSAVAQYSFVKSEGYRESFGGNTIESSDANSLTVGIDARLGYKFQRGYVEGRFGVAVELLDTELESKFTIIDGPGTTFSSQGGELDSAKIILGVESGYRLSEGWVVKGGLLGEFGDSHLRVTGNVTFTYSW